MLSGKIPELLGNCPQLAELHLHANHLTGPVPKQLAKCTALTALTVDEPLLETLPPALRELALKSPLSPSRKSSVDGVIQRRS